MHYNYRIYEKQDKYMADTFHVINRDHGGNDYSVITIDTVQCCQMVLGNISRSYSAY